MIAGRAAITFDFDTLARDLFRPALDSNTFHRLECVSFERILPRILDWLDRERITATFFAIGRHAEEHGAALAEIARRGHEVSNHSFHHHREFASLAPAQVTDEIARAHDALGAATGRAPAGFRSPGYTLSAPVIDALGRLGYRYDASVIPSWFYSTAKQLYRVFGGSDFREYLHPQGLRCMTAPKQPYPIASQALFNASPGAAVLEMPQTTVGPVQFPLIYGLLAKLPAHMQRWCVRLALAQPFVTIGFHDLEFVSQEDLGGLPVGALTRVHVAEPITARLSRLGTITAHIARTHEFGAMRDIAAAYRPAPDTGVVSVDA